MNRRKFVHEYKGDIVCASGMIPFCKKGKKIFLLVQIKDGMIEDFGGVADRIDAHPIDTAIRETVEESNASIFGRPCRSRAQYWRDWRNERKKLIYHVNLVWFRGVYEYLFPDFKYALYLVKFNSKQLKKISPEKFGEREFHDNIKRKVNWISVRDLRNYELHPRLRYLNQICEDL